MSNPHTCMLIGCHEKASTKHRALWLCNRHYRERTGATAENLSQWTDPQT